MIIIQYCFCYSLSIFIFIFLLVFISPFKFYLILCYICFFISYLCHRIYYHFISLFILRNPLSKECRERINSFILFLLQAYMKTRFSFSVSFQITIFLRENVLHLTKQLFYLICCPDFMMSLEHCSDVFWPSLLRVALKLSGNQVWAFQETLCSLRWSAGMYSIFQPSFAVICIE